MPVIFTHHEKVTVHQEFQKDVKIKIKIIKGEDGIYYLDITDDGEVPAFSING